MKTISFVITAVSSVILSGAFAFADLPDSAMSQHLEYAEYVQQCRKLMMVPQDIEPISEGDVLASVRFMLNSQSGFKSYSIYYIQSALGEGVLVRKRSIEGDGVLLRQKLHSMESPFAKSIDFQHLASLGVVPVVANPSGSDLEDSETVVMLVSGILGSDSKLILRKFDPKYEMEASFSRVVAQLKKLKF
jgi:hypothetical protein